MPNIFIRIYWIKIPRKMISEWYRYLFLPKFVHISLQIVVVIGNWWWVHRHVTCWHSIGIEGRRRNELLEKSMKPSAIFASSNRPRRQFLWYVRRLADWEDDTKSYVHHGKWKPYPLFPVNNVRSLVSKACCYPTAGRVCPILGCGYECYSEYLAET